MKIEKLLVDIKRANFDMEKELQVKKYLPMEVKKTIAQGIIYECTENVDGFIKLDSVQQYLSYVKYMIRQHTNLEYTTEDYDVLCATEYGNTDLMTAIFNLFKKDADSCNEILTLAMKDYVQENSIELVVAKFLHNVADALSNKLDEFDIESLLPQDFDAEKLTKFLNTYVK